MFDMEQCDEIVASAQDAIRDEFYRGDWLFERIGYQPIQQMRRTEQGLDVSDDSWAAYRHCVYAQVIPIYDVACVDTTDAGVEELVMLQVGEGLKALRRRMRSDLFRGVDSIPELPPRLVSFAELFRCDGFQSLIYPEDMTWAEKPAVDDVPMLYPAVLDVLAGILPIGQMWQDVTGPLITNPVLYHALSTLGRHPSLPPVAPDAYLSDKGVRHLVLGETPIVSEPLMHESAMQESAEDNAIYKLDFDALQFRVRPAYHVGVTKWERLKTDDGIFATLIWFGYLHIKRWGTHRKMVGIKTGDSV